MTFRYLPDVALADIAFEAEGASLDELFEACAVAVTDIMVDPTTLRPTLGREITLTSDDADRLLYDFLTELIIAKDVDSLLFRDYSVKVSSDGRSLRATARGEPIDRERHTLRNDVKAVTMHMFGVRHEQGRWKATVVLDI
ncbi:MAG: archease [Nitrososphaerota archaeon]|nr:archease [Nitrososphaerota archaeon]MDG6942245.1 archease [Nitrososphaerota archaeon]MDG6942710.1 archease [Nitrososphaerota archaeon]MDG6948497.1 archease [Nitrososphaerota archaeon]MDG6950423.1 archease [Nitrososphaerota archaeon]